MRKINVRLGKRSYRIYVGKNLIINILNLMPSSILKNPILIITNKKINYLFGKPLLKALKNTSNKIQVKEVPDSERAKSFRVYNQIISCLASIGRNAKPAILALGGGVIGDVSGFAASTYRRGIPYVQIPTTLLAQVDSSIGGKVAIDLPQAKNIVGSFYQPKAVICDVSILKTLPKREIRNGLAEIIKYGIITDKALFRYISGNLKNILTLKEPCLQHLVFRCATIKAQVVEKDELDTKGIRAILNFGHTFGHAIETSVKYSKLLSHGEAVAMGMVLACDTAAHLQMIKKGEVNKIKKVLRRAGFPLKLKSLNIKRIMNAIEYDKKFLDGTNRFVLPRKIGDVEIVEEIPDILISNVLNERLRQKKR